MLDCLLRNLWMGNFSWMFLKGQGCCFFFLWKINNNNKLWYCSFIKEKKRRKKGNCNISLIYKKRLKVLKINCINTDWSILFFFDLKNYISYCKDVYKYFNLSSVNFFVAGLNLFYFLVWPHGQRTLYYFNITQIVNGIAKP